MLPARFLTPYGTPGSAAVRTIPTTTRNHVLGMSLDHYQRVLDESCPDTPRPAPRPAPRSGTGDAAGDAGDAAKSKLSIDTGLRSDAFVPPAPRGSAKRGSFGRPPRHTRAPRPTRTSRTSRIVWTAPANPTGNPTAKPMFEFKQLDHSTGAYKYYEAYLPKIKQAQGIQAQVELMDACGNARKLRAIRRKQRLARKRRNPYDNSHDSHGKPGKPDVDDAVVRKILLQPDVPVICHDPDTDVELLTDDETNPEHVDTYEHRRAVLDQRHKKRQRLEALADQKQAFHKFCKGWRPSMHV